MKVLSSIVLAFVLMFTASISIPQSQPKSPSQQTEFSVLDKVRQNTFTVISAEDHVGTSVLITRKRGNDNIHFMLTAAHVVSYNQYLEVGVDQKTNATRAYVKYQPLQVSQTKTQNGLEVAEFRYDADIIRYSSRKGGQDLALLQLRMKNITTNTTSFLCAKKLPLVGASIWHCGTMGATAPGSISDGVIAYVGRVDADSGRVLDQISVIATKGCSGGGIFLKENGQCLGLILEYKGALGSMYMLPSRKIYDWAKSVNALWLLDESLPVPSDEEIRATPVNDVPVPLSAVRAAIATKEKS